MHLHTLVDPYALRQDGSEPLTANWDAGPYKITTGQLESNVAIGTAPLVITSTTLVSNLNADLWDGYQFADYLDQAVKTTSSPTFVGGTFSAVVIGVTPTAGEHFATKEYVDLAIGASKDYFLSDNDDVVIADYHILHETDTGEAGSTLTTDPMTENDDQLMFSYITASGVPGTTSLLAGVFILHAHLSRGTGDKPTTFYWTLSKRILAGTETVLMSSEESSAIPDSIMAFITHATLASDETILATDRLVLKLYANVGAAGGNSEVTIHMEGTHDCHLTNQLPSDIWQNQGDVLDDLNTLGIAASNGQFIVATGGGVFTYEKDNTARTSLGLGTGSIPTFKGLIVSPGIATVDKLTNGTLDILNSSITGMVNAGMSGELTFTAPTDSDIQMGGFGTGGLYIEGATANNPLVIDYFTASGDGDDSVFFQFFAKGTRADLVNTESCAIGYAASLTAMFIETFVGGEGTTLRPIKIFTQGNTDQLSIEIDGTNKMLPTYSHTITSNVRDLQIDDAGILGYVAASALKDKTNIRDLEGSEKIYDLRPIRFDRIDGLSIDAVGLIVEEADLVMPDIVSCKTNYITETVEDEDLGPSEIVVGYDRTDIPETVVYSRLIVPMLKQLQILKQRIEQLESVA